MPVRREPRPLDPLDGSGCRVNRFFVRRPSGYLSPYSARMFYVAAITLPRQFGNLSVPMIRIGQRLYVMPRLAMELFRPFNRYRDSQGNPVSTFVKSSKEKR